jgi:hypothetical protein
MAEKFEGFANAPVDEDGKRLDFRDVDAFVDESDEGKVRDGSQTTPSSITQFHTDDQSTDGAPAANVPAVGEDKTGGVPDPGNEAEPVDAEGEPAAKKTRKTTTAKAAGGKEGAAS